LVLIQEKHDAEISQSLICKARTSDQLETFYLAKMGRRAEHVDIEEFCDIVVSLVGVFFPERGTDGGRFLLDEGAFVCDGLGQG
jgi:hypothetical protein